MQVQEGAVFTATEAAVLTRLSLKAVNNAIDRKTVVTVAGRHAGSVTRLLDMHALISLALERRLVDYLVPEVRLEVFAAAAVAPRNRVSLQNGFMIIDLREPRRELARALRALRRAREAVVSDPDILGGDPVFRGTRVPVHLIATLLEKGQTEAALLHDYPRMTTELVRLAPIYAAAYPLRGRRRAQPWRDRPPIESTRRKLATIEAGWDF